MAFCNKLSGILRQGVSQSSNGPVTSMLGSLRYMSSKLFVGGLSWGTDDSSLKQAFTSFGEVTEATVIADRETGRSRGFGFVSFSCEDSANNAIKEMDGKELNGRQIRVNLATERSSAPRSSFGGGGGYGSGGGGGY
ncbi:unnamed protein product [Arabidopsis thaliana]|uniref:(thale cress) hypothetical protein n=1 Tax=Arabidopsis thaliana TaxID=3702 RepID=A0A7G2EKR9_ARATH|nr:unnamed protein product [Arabidopsis thaliana]